MLVCVDGTFVDGNIVKCEANGRTLLRYPDGPVVVACPARYGILRIEILAVGGGVELDGSHELWTVAQHIVSLLGERHQHLIVDECDVAVLTQEMLILRCEPEVFVGDAILAQEVVLDSHAVAEGHVVGVLHIVGFLVGLAVDVDDAVLHL